MKIRNFKMVFVRGDVNKKIPKFQTNYIFNLKDLPQDIDLQEIAGKLRGIMAESQINENNKIGQYVNQS